MRRVSFAIIAVMAFTLAPITAYAGRLAIVIDDLGYNLDRGRQAVMLPAPVSLSILPFTPDAKAIAEFAHHHGKEVLLHQPLESDHGIWADGMLTTSMTPDAIAEGFRKALLSVPFAIGINNHTGSRFTRDQRAMNALMRVIAQIDRRLLFLDSRTTADTVAELAARRQNVPFVARDVFIDHNPDRTAMAAAFDKAIRRAQTHGYAVAIAHPKPATLAFLETRLKDLGDTNVVPISALLKPNHRVTLARHRSRAFLRTAPTP